MTWGPAPRRTWPRRGGWRWSPSAPWTRISLEQASRAWVPWVTIWSGLMTILDDRFDSSEVYLMKKMIRWSLAFATVMAIPTSAMALVGTDYYDATLLNGAYPIPIGTL